MGWDLLLTGAEVIDVGGGHLGRFDIAVQSGRVAAVAPSLDGPAAQRLDLTGKLITPGPGRPAHPCVRRRRLLGYQTRPDRLAQRRDDLG